MICIEEADLSSTSADISGTWESRLLCVGSISIPSVVGPTLKVHSDTFSLDLEKKPNVTRAEDVHYITVEKFAFFQREDGISVQGGRVLVARERWNWKMSPIRAAADASRESRVRHLPHCRTVERRM